MIRLKSSLARKASMTRRGLAIPGQIARGIHKAVVKYNLSPAKRWEGEGE